MNALRRICGASAGVAGGMERHNNAVGLYNRDKHR